MAATTTAVSLLLISLLSLSTTTTLATFISPLTIPSCSSQLNFAKCYQDYKAAYGAKASAEIGTAASAIAMAFNAVNAAKASCNTALQFFNSMKGSSPMSITCQNTFTVAVHYLGQASVVMQGKTDLTKSEALEVQKSVKVAAQNVLKCTSSNKSPATKTQTSEPVNLCNIALNFCKMIGGH